MLVVLSLHNLSIQSKGLSHHGYFHWRTHISHFIEKNWNYLIGPTVKRKKKWTGTISGTLSHNTPTLFTPGINVFKEAGWWKLSRNLNPKKYMEYCMCILLFITFSCVNFFFAFPDQSIRTEKRKFDEVYSTEIEPTASTATDVLELDTSRRHSVEIPENLVFSRSL